MMRYIKVDCILEIDGYHPIEHNHHCDLMELAWELNEVILPSYSMMVEMGLGNRVEEEEGDTNIDEEIGSDCNR